MFFQLKKRTDREQVVVEKIMSNCWYWTLGTPKIQKYRHILIKKDLCSLGGLVWLRTDRKVKYEYFLDVEDAIISTEKRIDARALDVPWHTNIPRLLHCPFTKEPNCSTICFEKLFDAVCNRLSAQSLWNHLKFMRDGSILYLGAP